MRASNRHTHTRKILLSRIFLYSHWLMFMHEWWWSDDDAWDGPTDAHEGLKKKKCRVCRLKRFLLACSSGLPTVVLSSCLTPDYRLLVAWCCWGLLFVGRRPKSEIISRHSQPWYRFCLVCYTGTASSYYWLTAFAGWRLLSLLIFYSSYIASQFPSPVSFRRSVGRAQSGCREQTSWKKHVLLEDGFV